MVVSLEETAPVVGNPDFRVGWVFKAMILTVVSLPFWGSFCV